MAGKEAVEKPEAPPGEGASQGLAQGAGHGEGPRGEALRTLWGEGEDEGVVRRLESYDTILAKLRSLAVALCESIAAKDWDEVNRHVTLINGLSAMIRDDARAILEALSTTAEEPTAAETENFC